MSDRAAPPPFIIYALPRSRTYWLSRFLSTGGWHCGHDEMRHVRNLDDIRSWFSQPFTGTVETGAAPFWRLVQSTRPDIRTVVVRRPVAEVVESCMALNVGFDRQTLTRSMLRLDRKLDQIEARVPDVLSVTYNDLGDYSNSGVWCKMIMRHCQCSEMGHKYWMGMDFRTLQSDVVATIRYAAAFRPQMEKMAKIAKHEMLRALARAQTPDIEGVTIQQEPFDTFFHDAVGLMRDHCAQIGEDPDNFANKNVPLARRLHDRGVMQITTARCNGRMFGYLMTVFGPSLEGEGQTEALNLAFFASPEIPRIGMKMQRHSAEALRNKGIDRVFWRAGVRGSGPRLGTIARRLGAEPFGEMYKLELEAM